MNDEVLDFLNRLRHRADALESEFPVERGQLIYTNDVFEDPFGDNDYGTYRDLLFFNRRRTMIVVENAYNLLAADTVRFSQSTKSLLRFLPKHFLPTFEGHTDRASESWLSSFLFFLHHTPDESFRNIEILPWTTQNFRPITEQEKVDGTDYLVHALQSHYLYSVSGFDKLRMRKFAVTEDVQGQAEFSSFEKKVNHIFETSYRYPGTRLYDFDFENRPMNVRQCSLLLDVIALWKNIDNRFRRAPFLRDPLLYPCKHHVSFRQWDRLVDRQWGTKLFQCYKYWGDRYKGKEVSPVTLRALPVQIIIQTERWYYLARRKIAIIRLGLFYAAREQLPRGNERFDEQYQVTIPWHDVGPADPFRS